MTEQDIPLLAREYKPGLSLQTGAETLTQTYFHLYKELRMPRLRDSTPPSDQRRIHMSLKEIVEDLDRNKILSMGESRRGLCKRSE